MKQNFIRICICLLSLCLAACTAKDHSMTEPKTESPELTVTEDAVPGLMYVKTKTELTELSNGAYNFTPVFFIGGEFEERQRAEGLHLWYVASFDPNVPLTKAGAELNDLPDVEFVEPVTQIETREFNDPHWSKQWSLYNDGQKSIGASGEKLFGCDLNVLKAWQITTGSPNVIVAVSDTGCDLEHEDLKQNLWVNEAELYGQAGVDDDGNGYVDDIHGQTFCCDETGAHLAPSIEAGDHGTHVAGTIAAVSNNGLGISGIAGGNGSADSGVRLMIIQSISGNEKFPYNLPARAFQYAADNGASIINCSWGTKNAQPTPEVTKAGIEYFNKYAGMNKNNEQVGPMAGGLCIFAAGNESATVGYPAMEENVMAVSSVGADFVPAYYTNYGDWVDIAGIGGDAKKGYQIYSTLPGSKYGNMQGTSMACPSVSGVAALVLSKFQKPGFTRENLFEILTRTANPIIYNYTSKNLGSGLVDAYAALNYEDSAPAKPSGIKAESTANVIKLSVPNTDTNLRICRFFLSEGSLASLDPRNPSSEVSVYQLDIKGSEAEVETSFALDFNKTYHIRVETENYIGLVSPLSDEIIIATGNNNKPVISAPEGTEFVFKSHQVGYVPLNVVDPDGHALSYSLTGDLNNFTVKKVDGGVQIVVNSLKVPDNKTYSGSLVADDSYDTSEIAIKITILQNNAPEKISDIDNSLFASLGTSKDLDVASHFNDPDGETLSYIISCETEGIVSLSPSSNGIYTLNARTYGETLVKVAAKDARGASVETSFKVVVRDGKETLDLYPNPVVDYLNVRPANEETLEVSVFSRAGAKICSSESTQADPFNPVRIDMSGVSAGIYIVVIKSAEETSTRSIIKQ